MPMLFKLSHDIECKIWKAA